ncbi:MAG: hypothetical protein JXB05_25545 [Myxococcaceae bacterium]|nr:hypothetical protein [Myxococcaceae bacterium]
MATLRRGLVDKVKKAAARMSTRGVQVATQAGTRGARALVETTVAAVRTVDRLEEKLGFRSHKGSAAARSATGGMASKPSSRRPVSRASKPMSAKPARTTAKPRHGAEPFPEARPVALREGGRKTMPAVAPKRSKKAPGKQLKVKRGQKHLHTGR